MILKPQNEENTIHPSQYVWLLLLNWRSCKICWLEFLYFGFFFVLFFLVFLLSYGELVCNVFENFMILSFM